MLDLAPAPAAPRPAPQPAAVDRFDEHARDYARMAEALAWMAERWRERPSLEQAAAAVGLSPHHFQRVFTRWAGVSPKTFAQALAWAEARESLHGGASVLDAAYDVGLSGPSRLHDLALSQEAITPGEARRRGAGLELRWGCAPSPFGTALAVVSPRGLAGLGFVDADGGAESLDDMRRRWPAAEWTRDDTTARAYLAAAFGGESVPLHLIGPPYHVQVWRALLRIPEGSLATYTQVADWAGKPGAFRATGAAIGANPISYLIPCHRVLSRDGRLTGYHWGLPRKAAMLAWESARRAEAA